MTPPRPPQPQAGPERRLVPGTPPLLIAFTVVLALGFCAALIAALLHRDPPTCVRLYAGTGRLVEQWTTDDGVDLGFTAWSFQVRGAQVTASGNLVETPGVCP